MPTVASPAALERLAARLEREEARILDRWREETAASGEPSILSTLTRDDFYDHIPAFLEYLCLRLRGGHDNTSIPARQHGAHRWQQGLEFEEVIHEWSFLHLVLMERIKAHSAPAGLDPATLHQVYRLLAAAIEGGIAVSLGEYDARRRLEAALRARNLEAALEEREQREEARGRGLHEAVHDLRGSLTAVQLTSQLLEAHPIEGKAGDILKRLDEAIAGVNHMFGDLLDLARLEAGRERRDIAAFDAAELLRELCRDFQPLAETENLGLAGEGPESLTVRGDTIKVRRIAQNLVLNALKYTSAGRIEVAWRAEAGARWSFTVSDTGPGFIESTADALAGGLKDAVKDAWRRVTETGADAGEEHGPPAHTESAVTHGEGIGLTIVHRLCQLLNGVLEVDSDPRRGTIFRVLLPSDYPHEP